MKRLSGYPLFIAAAAVVVLCAGFYLAVDRHGSRRDGATAPIPRVVDPGRMRGDNEGSVPAYKVSPGLPDAEDSARGEREAPRRSRDGGERTHGTRSATGSLIQGLFRQDRPPDLPKGMTEEDIPPEYDRDPGQFYDRLEDVRSEKVLDLDDPGVDPLYFSTLLPDLLFGLGPHEPVFGTGSRKIYAYFSSQTELMTGRSRVLVKWFDQHGDEILFSYLDIMPDMPFNYIWKEKEYWDPGIYKVEVYELENGIGLLASGWYEIVPDADYIGYLGLYASEEQMFSQSGFLPTDMIVMKFDFINSAERSTFLQVYKIQNGEEILRSEIVLGEGTEGTFVHILKQPEDIFPLGSFYVELFDENGTLLARSKFIIDL